MFFPKFVYVTKNTPFFPILHVFASLNNVRAYSAWSWKTALITWIFGRAWYPLWHSSGPPRIPIPLLPPHFGVWLRPRVFAFVKHNFDTDFITILFDDCKQGSLHTNSFSFTNNFPLSCPETSAYEATSIPKSRIKHSYTGLKVCQRSFANRTNWSNMRAKQSGDWKDP